MNSVTTDLFSHGGEAGQALAAIDWTQSALGPVESWPAALRVVAQMMLASSFPKAICWGPDMVMLHNDAFSPILGDKPSPQGRPFAEVWSEAWGSIGPIAEKAMAGEATFIENFPLVVNRHGYDEQCHFTFCYSPIYDETGQVGGFMDTVIETSETVKAQNALRVRNAELAHRMKNTFAVVSAIARRTLSAAQDTAAAWDKLSPRLGALSEAHMALSEGSGHAASMREVISGALRPHIGDGARVPLHGPLLRLGEREAMAVSLAVNELATNALKHGALASGGEVRVSWELTGADAFRFHWSETGATASSGAPDVSREEAAASGGPSTGRKGFGLQLLERIIPQDVDGASEIVQEPGRFDYWLDGRVRDPVATGQGAQHETAEQTG